MFLSISPILMTRMRVSMNTNDVSSQLLYSTVPIVGETASGIVSGTGFLFSYHLKSGETVPLLITNYHVLREAERGMFAFNLDKDGQPSRETVNVNFDRRFVEGHQLGNLDLLAFPIAPIISMLERNGKRPFYRSVDPSLVPDKQMLENLMALEEITFIGYPNGLYDDFNKTPLIRRGWTATPVWNDYKGEKEFIIDASVFPGSSGSPAFIFNQGSYSTGDGISIGSRLLFVGVVTSTLTVRGHEHLDLGKVIRSDALIAELEPYVEQLLSRDGSS